MNRDALLATVIGFIIGIGITSVLLFGPTFMKNFPTIRIPSISLPKLAGAKPDSAVTTQTTSEKGPIKKLSLNAPADQAILDTTDVTVSGSAPAGSTVVIGGPLDETVIKTDANGAFSGTVSVEEGTNSIDVAAFHEDTTETIHRTVYYTQEKL